MSNRLAIYIFLFIFFVSSFFFIIIFNLFLSLLF